MRIVIGDVWQRTIDAQAVSISRAISDPVPTCQVVIRDNTSSYTPPELAELLILDEHLIPNPTINLLTNPTLNPYNNFGWGSFVLPGGLTLSQQSGGGMVITLANTAAGTTTVNGENISFRITPGVSYMFSGVIQGAGGPSNFHVDIQLVYGDVNGNTTGTFTLTGATPPSTSATTITLQTTAPAGSVNLTFNINVVATSGTNAGTATLTNFQFEPMWFSDISYPTPFCGPGQTNCTEVDDFNPMYIRQYRRFAGYVNHAVAGNYHGVVRDWTIDAVGYAWLLSAILANDSFTNQTDAAIISSLITKYFALPGGRTPTFTLTNVITGVTLSNFGLNWDDIRTAIDNLASSSGFYWTVDYYRNLLYQPPGWTSMAISLICDHSSTPDMLTTFPAYNFSAEYDFTQPGNSALVIGSGSNVSLVIDPNTSNANANQNIRWLQTTSVPFFTRKVNNSALQSTTDTTTRGIAEVLIYDYTRNIYHLTTNVELVPGQNIAVTSSTDNLSATSLLIQSIKAQWLGRDETLADAWEYQADLGPVNRAAANMISRIFRATNANTSAPAISTTVLAVFESANITDTAATASTATGYQATILGDTPLAYYRMNALEGTVVDDYSGGAFAGATHGSPTLGVATLLTDPADSSDLAMTFAHASSQYISLPTSFVPTGAHAWSIECWAKTPAAIPANGFYTVIGMGDSSANHKKGVITLDVTATPTCNWLFTTGNGDISGPATVVASTTYHLVGTYDGTNIRLYINGTLVAGPTAFALNLAATFATIGANDNAVAFFYTGTIDECAFYNFALSAAQVSAHFTAGT